MPPPAPATVHKRPVERGGRQGSKTRGTTPLITLSGSSGYPGKTFVLAKGPVLGFTSTSQNWQSIPR